MDSSDQFRYCLRLEIRRIRKKFQLTPRVNALLERHSTQCRCCLCYVPFFFCYCYLLLLFIDFKSQIFALIQFLNLYRSGLIKRVFFSNFALTGVLTACSMVFVGNTAISGVPNKGDGAVFFHLSSIVGNTLSVYGIVSITLIDPDFTASACKLSSTSMR